MKQQITVLVERSDGTWKVLHQGTERIRVELAEKDQEASQIDSYVFKVVEDAKS